RHSLSGSGWPWSHSASLVALVLQRECLTRITPAAGVARDPLVRAARLCDSADSRMNSGILPGMRVTQPMARLSMSSVPPRGADAPLQSRVLASRFRRRIAPRLSVVAFPPVFAVCAGLLCFGMLSGCTKEEKMKPGRSEENSLGMKMIRVPAGTFTMGAPASDAKAKDDERPAHSVQLNAFEI